MAELGMAMELSDAAGPDAGMTACHLVPLAVAVII